MPPPINTEPYKGSLCPPPPTHHYHVVPSGLCCFRGGARSSPPPRSPATRWAPRPAPLRLRPWRPGGAAYGEGGVHSQYRTAPPPRTDHAALFWRARCFLARPPGGAAWREMFVNKPRARARRSPHGANLPPPPPYKNPAPIPRSVMGRGLWGGGGRCSLGGTVALEGGILWSQGGPYNLGEAPWSWGGPYGLGGSL